MFEIVDHPIDVARVRAAVLAPDCGAVLIFEGTTRDSHDGKPVQRLAYECYEPLAIREFEQIAQEAAATVGRCNVAIVHRTGAVPIGHTSVAIAVSTPHRDAAYIASRYAIDQLKLRASIWKKEIYTDGSAWKANTP
jgi:MoaE-MoaD fusion protein